MIEKITGYSVTDLAGRNRRDSGQTGLGNNSSSHVDKPLAGSGPVK